MATLFQVIMDTGTQYAANLEQQIPHLQNEILDLNALLANKENELKAARHAHERATQLPDLLRREIICPYCWVGDSRQATLRAVGQGPGDPDLDIFRCNACDRPFEV